MNTYEAQELGDVVNTVIDHYPAVLSIVMIGNFIQANCLQDSSGNWSDSYWEPETLHGTFEEARGSCGFFCEQHGLVHN